MNNKIVSKEQLVDVALGALPADIVIKGGNLVNVLTREIYKADIVIFGNRVAATGACDYQVSPDTKIIEREMDCTGIYGSAYAFGKHGHNGD